MKKTLWIIIGLIIYFFAIKYLFFVLLPFLLAILFYFMVRPFLLFLESIFHIRHHLIGMIFLLLIYLMIIIVMIFAGMSLISFFMRYINDIPYIYQNVIAPFIQDITIYFHEHFSLFDLSIVQQYAGEYIIRLMNLISSCLSGLPSFFFSLFLFMTATFFLFFEYDQIKEKIQQTSSVHGMDMLIFMKDRCLKSIKSYIYCQGILMLLCFLCLSIGFVILKMDHPFLLALILAWFDSLPFIGVGIALIPLSLVFFFQGLTMKALYLFLIYVFIMMMHSFLEPRIMNQQMKIPSFVLLLSMVVHMSLFGFVGILLSPIHVNLLYSYLDIKKEK